MSVQSYRDQRSRISLDELSKHRNKCAAFSLDGSKIIASDANLEEVAKKAQAAGFDSQECVFEFVEFADVHLGAADLL